MNLNSLRSAFRPAVLLAGSLLTLCCASASAGTATGKVQSYLATNGPLFVVHVGDIANRAGCTTSHEWAIDATTAGGKAMIATILAAHAQGLSVTIYGAGNCNFWPDRETATGVKVG